MTFEGKLLAEKILKELKVTNHHPGLAVVLVGEDPVSLSYVQKKEEIAQNLGVVFKLYHLAGFSSQEEVEKLICDLNENKFIQGIVIQLPLPNGFEVDKILQTINPQKDIDGFSGIYPAPTVQAILELLDFYRIDVEGKKIVIVGHGRLVGKPLEVVLQKQGVKPIICNSKTENLSQITASADILISATGVAGIIKPEMVSKEAIVIDAGSSEVSGHILGDVEKKVYEKVKSYSPVPGGVGPVTVAILMRNLFKAKE